MNEKTANKMMSNARLACFAIWGVLTLMATAALVHAVPVTTSHADTTTTSVVTGQTD